MGSGNATSANQWTTSRILRLVVPPLIALGVALVLREPKHEPEASPAERSTGGIVADTELAAGKAVRVLLLGEGMAPLAEELRRELGGDFDLVIAPTTAERELLGTYGVTQKPAVIIERAGEDSVVCQGADANLAAVRARWQELGLPGKPE